MDYNEYEWLTELVSNPELYWPIYAVIGVLVATVIRNSLWVEQARRDAKRKEEK